MGLNDGGLRAGGLRELSAIGLPVTNNIYYRWKIAGLSGTDGDVVDPWTDSEKGHDLTANGDPTLNSGSLNGNDAIDLDGSGDWYSEPNSFTSVSQPFTYYIVLDLDSGTDQRVISADGPVPLRYSGSNWFAKYGSSVYGSSSTSTNLITVRADGSNSVIREDTSETGSGDVGTGDLPNFWVGGKFGDAGDELVDGRIGEILVYDVAHSSGTIADIEDFLVNKWGI